METSEEKKLPDFPLISKSQEPINEPTKKTDEKTNHTVVTIENDIKTINAPPPVYHFSGQTNDQLCCSIGTLICNIFCAIFCLPFSIAAIVFSCIARSKLIDANIIAGRTNAKISLILIIFNFVGQLVFWLFWIIIIILIVSGVANVGYFVLKLFMFPIKFEDYTDVSLLDIAELLIKYIFEKKETQELLRMTFKGLKFIEENLKDKVTVF